MRAFLWLFLCFVTSKASSTYANAGFSGAPVTLVAPSYPQVAPLPANRNNGFVQGKGLLLLPSGLIVVQGGDYLISHSTILFGNETASSPTEFNVFLVVDGELNANVVSASNSVPPGQVVQFQATNILLNLEPGQLLQLVIDHGAEEGLEIGVTMFAWLITAIQL